VFENSLELEYPLSELEPLSFILARLLNQLCARLNAYALATNELHLSLETRKRNQPRAHAESALPDARSQSFF